MYNRDYILQMIEQLGRVLARIFSGIELKDYEMAVYEIDEAYKELLGFDPALIRHLSGDKIQSYLKITGTTQFEKSYIIARLMKAEAEIIELKTGSQNDSAIDKYMTSFSLLVDSFLNREELRKEEFFSDADTVLNKINNYILPDDLIYKVFRYNELRGRYADAEDNLFELVDKSYPGIITEGKNFYKRLLAKTDDELLKGNLPRNEVEDSLLEIERKL